MSPSLHEDSISFAAYLSLSLIATLAAIARAGGCFLLMDRRPWRCVICVVWALASIGILGVISSNKAGSIRIPMIPWIVLFSKLIDLDDIQYQQACNILLLTNCGFPVFFEVRLR